MSIVNSDLIDLNEFTDKTFVLKGNNANPVFIFVHGWASLPTDLMPIAKSFNEEGNTCVLLLLEGHGESMTELSNAKYDEWYNQIERVYNKYHTDNKKVFLFGFSLGATICLDFASRNNVDGVVSISGFFSFRHPKSSLFFLRLIKNFRTKWKRNLHTTSKDSRKETAFHKYIPLQAVESILKESNRVKKMACYIRCPVIFFHSIDDKVSRYADTAAFCNALNECGRMVTLQQLDHFIQFDIPPTKIRDIAIYYFKESKEYEKESAMDNNMLTVQLEQLHLEAGRWSDVMFRLVLTFFTIFGFLLYNSLPDVTTKSTEAPYYLVSYSLVINIYLILASLYYFYINRSIAYLVHHVEPFIIGLPSKTYRTISFASGPRITGGISVIVFAMPLLISLLSITYGIYEYNDCFLIVTKSNMLLQLWMLVSIATFLCIIATLIKVTKHARFQLSIVPKLYNVTAYYELLLRKLYISVTPGCIHQSKREEKK